MKTYSNGERQAIVLVLTTTGFFFGAAFFFATLCFKGTSSSLESDIVVYVQLDDRGNSEKPRLGSTESAYLV